MSSHISNVASYPPKFRPIHEPNPNLVSDPSDPSVDESPDPLPVVDMTCLDEAKLHVACSEWGIFRIVNHGVPEKLIARVQAEAKSVFDLSFESKQALLKDPNPVYSWGSPALTLSRVQCPKGLPEVGWEIIGFGLAPREVTCQEPELPQEAAVASFRAILEAYGEQMTRLSQELFSAMAKNLKLDQTLIEQGKYLDKSSGLLRVNRYPPYSSSGVEPQVKGLDAHTDSSVLTVLLQDDVPGLELFKDGIWLPVKPIPNTLIVNLGDMLQAMSDDEYKSVEHKVRLNKLRERISVGYFVFPEENTVVTGSKGKYRPFTNKEFRAQVQEDVANFGWKVGLSRFRV